MYQLLKPLLFQINPEKAHHLTLSLLKTALAIPGYAAISDATLVPDNSKWNRTVAGLHFKNPIGLAAGFDKNAEYIPLIAHLGFAFIEVGTITPKPQSGNDTPRLFRLPKDKALINRMGFNNDGVEVMLKNLNHKKTITAREKYKLIIGGNIGKNKITPNADAWKDYNKCFEKLHPYVDYFVVNVSSPNTPGLRELQEKEPLKYILSQLQDLNNKLGKKPLFLKIAPDLTDAQLNDIISVVKETQLTGLIISNTTIERSGLKTSDEEIQIIGTGGLSGKPLLKKSNDVLWYVRRIAGKDLVLIGAGGILNGDDANSKFDRGASLVQVYSGLIYEGPALVKNILKAI
ncbi:MAG: quinone-dependent dihydroorotate dehydrogenase [Bacteroidetes bacterium]|nr:quinone-dependent dihydroorotate dehydrogenase [Bacteroidota bacterium]